MFKAKPATTVVKARPLKESPQGYGAFKRLARILTPLCTFLCPGAVYSPTDGAAAAASSARPPSKRTRLA